MMAALPEEEIQELYNKDNGVITKFRQHFDGQFNSNPGTGEDTYVQALQRASQHDIVDIVTKMIADHPGNLVRRTNP